MLAKLKELCRVTSAVQGQSVSIRRRLHLYWLSMALAVFAALVLVLSFAGVFSNSAQKLQESLTLQQQNTVTLLADHMDALNAQCITLSKQVTGELNNTLLAYGKTFDDLNNDEQLIVELEGKLYPLLNTALQSSACSGVFLLLDATCNTEAAEAEHSRMGIYLRYSDLSGVNTANKHMVYFRGVPEVARREKVQMHNRWNLEFNTDLVPGYDKLMNTSVARLADHCLWTERINLKDTWEDAILLCVPILGSDGVVRGICGVELSELYFRLSYPAADSPYGSIMLALAPIKGNKLSLEQAVLGASCDTILEPMDVMTVSEGKYYNTYSVGTRDYIGLHQVLPVTSVSGKEVVAMTLISETSYQNEVSRERVIWITGSLLFLLAMLLLSWLLTRHFVTPIAQLLEVVRKELPLEGQRSGISEIDELVDYIQAKAQSQSEGELPPNIEELFHTFTQRVASLTPMERTVLQYYIEGCSVEEVAARSFISVNTVKKHNTNINRKLGVTTREELMLYIDLFRRCGRIEEIAYHS